jgi:phosphinothricin acetyltransferase
VSSVDFRPAAPQDFELIAAICNHYIERTAIHFGSEPVTAEQLRADWRGQPEFPYWVACDAEGSLVGYAKSGPWRTRPAYRWTAEVGIYLAPGSVGRGVGRPLYVRLLEDCERRGFRSAIGGIALPNEASVKLHRALGFEDVGTVRDAGFKHGAWHDVQFWQKRFSTDAAPPRADRQ